MARRPKKQAKRNGGNGTPGWVLLLVGLLVGVVLIMGGLEFFPALALGPIVEHLSVVAGQTF